MKHYETMKNVFGLFVCFFKTISWYSRASDIMRKDKVPNCVILVVQKYLVHMTIIVPNIKIRMMITS